MNNGQRVSFTDPNKRGKTFNGVVEGDEPRTEAWHPKGRKRVKLDDGSIVVVHEQRLSARDSLAGKAGWAVLLAALLAWYEARHSQLPDGNAERYDLTKYVPKKRSW